MCRFGVASFVVPQVRGSGETFPAPRSRGMQAWFGHRRRHTETKLSYRWVIVAIGAVMTCVGIGAMFSLAVYLEPMSADTGWSRAGISSAMTLGFLVIGVWSFHWRVARMAIGIPTWILLIRAALLVRRPSKATHDDSAAAANDAAGRPGMSAVQALRSPQFVVLALTFFLCCAAHSGPIFHMVSYAMLCGVPAMAAVSIYSVEGLAGLGGRLLLGVLADRLGVKPVLVAGLLVQALAIGAYLFVGRLGEFYLLAVVFGTAYCGVMPPYAFLAREYFGQHIIGTGFGAATMASSLGLAFGPF